MSGFIRRYWHIAYRAVRTYKCATRNVLFICKDILAKQEKLVKGFSNIAACHYCLSIMYSENYDSFLAFYPQLFNNYILMVTYKYVN